MKPATKSPFKRLQCYNSYATLIIESVAVGVKYTYQTPFSCSLVASREPVSSFCWVHRGPRKMRIPVPAGFKSTPHRDGMEWIRNLPSPKVGIFSFKCRKLNDLWHKMRILFLPRRRPTESSGSESVADGDLCTISDSLTSLGPLTHFSTNPMMLLPSLSIFALMEGT